MSGMALAMGLVTLVIGLSVALIVISAIVPVSIENMVNVDTGNWTTGTSNLFDQIPLFAMVGIVIGILGSGLAVIMTR